jgi:hypothetical protein
MSEISPRGRSIIGIVSDGTIYFTEGFFFLFSHSACAWLILQKHDRWHGDPATARRAVTRHGVGGVSTSTAGEDADADEDTIMDYPESAPLDSTSVPNGMNGLPPDQGPPMPFMNPQNAQNPKDAGLSLPYAQTAAGSSTQARPADQTPVNISVTQGMLTTYLQYLQTQSQTSKLKLEYLRRREEREEKESVQRRELERLRMEREAAQWEHSKQSADAKQKADRAIELLSNPIVDASVKQVAGEYLKKLFTAE